MTSEPAGGGSRQPLIPFLSAGFRPFFLLGAFWAGVAIAVWIAAFSGAFALPGAFPVLDWHRHEMLYGFVGAVIAGFLLTAIPNWTGRPFLTGIPLAGLVAAWLGARLAILLSGHIGLAPAVVLDVGFFLALTVWALRQIVLAGNRNVPIPLLIALFGASAGVDYLRFVEAGAMADLGYRGGLGVVVLLLSLIGGRIVPAFTRNWLAQVRAGEPLPVQASRADLVAIAATALAMVAWTAAPLSVVAGALVLAAGVLQVFRLGRWQGWRTTAEPLVTVLHVAYAWVPAGLILLGLSVFLTAIPYSAALHALTAGAMGGMTLAVMTRAALGHTGRSLTARPRELAIFTLVHAGAIGRVAAAFLPEVYLTLLGISSVLWAGAFLLFAVSYAPVLLGPRREEAAD